MALNLKESYDNLGFVRLRNKENEEPLFAVAMALCNEKLSNHDGTIKADAMYYEDIRTNVLTGKREVSRANYKIAGGEQIPSKGKPAILHFNNYYTRSYIYLKDVSRLNLKKNGFFIEIVFFFYFDLISHIKKFLKKIFRPVYRVFIGKRTISVSHRLV